MADPRAALDAAALRGPRGVDLTVWPPRYDRAYRPAPDAEHWLPEVECADPAARDAPILAKLTRQVRYAWGRTSGRISSTRSSATRRRSGRCPTTWRALPCTLTSSGRPSP